MTDWQTDRSTDRPTNQQTYMRVHRTVTRSIIMKRLWCGKQVYREPMFARLNVRIGQTHGAEQNIQGVQEKLCLFTIHCNPSLAHIAVRDFQSSSAMRVHTHSYWLVIFVQPIAAECRWGRGGKLPRILGKKTQYLMNTLYNRPPLL